MGVNSACWGSGSWLCGSDVDVHWTSVGLIFLICKMSLIVRATPEDCFED